jgi:hypothetical protein
MALMHFIENVLARFPNRDEHRFATLVRRLQELSTMPPGQRHRAIERFGGLQPLAHEYLGGAPEFRCQFLLTLRQCWGRTLFLPFPFDGCENEKESGGAGESRGL